MVINFDLLKSPMNWALVAFSAIVLVFGFHCLIGVSSNDES